MDFLAGIIYHLRSKLVFLEKCIAGISLLILLALALGQVILRNVFEMGFSELDVIARHLVLFITFMGAALVSESNQHIKIDCLNTVIKRSLKQRLKRPLLLLSSMISGVFFYYALQFWLDEKTYAPANEQLALYLALIIPFGFFTLCLHFLLLMLSPQTTEDDK